MNRPGALAALGLVCLALGAIIAAFGATTSYNASLHPNVVTTTLAIGGTELVSIGGDSTTVTLPTTVERTVVTTVNPGGTYSETVTTYTTYYTTYFTTNYTTSTAYSTAVNTSTYTTTSVVGSTTVQTIVSTSVYVVSTTTSYTCDIYNFSSTTITQCV